MCFYRGGFSSDEGLEGCVYIYVYKGCLLSYEGLRGCIYSVVFRVATSRTTQKLWSSAGMTSLRCQTFPTIPRSSLLAKPGMPKTRKLLSG